MIYRLTTCSQGKSFAFLVFGNLGATVWAQTMRAQPKTRRKAKITYQFQPNVGDQKLVLLVLRERRHRRRRRRMRMMEEKEKREGKLFRQLGDFPRIGW